MGGRHHQRHAWISLRMRRKEKCASSTFSNFAWLAGSWWGPCRSLFFSDRRRVTSSTRKRSCRFFISRSRTLLEQTTNLQQQKWRTQLTNRWTTSFAPGRYPEEDVDAAEDGVSAAEVEAVVAEEEAADPCGGIRETTERLPIFELVDAWCMLSVRQPSLSFLLIHHFYLPDQWRLVHVVVYPIYPPSSHMERKHAPFWR